MFNLTINVIKVFVHDCIFYLQALECQPGRIHLFVFELSDSFVTLCVLGFLIFQIFPKYILLLIKMLIQRQTDEMFTTTS